MGDDDDMWCVASVGVTRRVVWSLSARLICALRWCVFGASVPQCGTWHKGARIARCHLGLSLVRVVLHLLRGESDGAASSPTSFKFVWPSSFGVLFLLRFLMLVVAPCASVVVRGTVLGWRNLMVLGGFALVNQGWVAAVASTLVWTVVLQAFS